MGASISYLDPNFASQLRGHVELKIEDAIILGQAIYSASLAPDAPESEFLCQDGDYGYYAPKLHPELVLGALANAPAEIAGSIRNLVEQAAEQRYWLYFDGATDSFYPQIKVADPLDEVSVYWSYSHVFAAVEPLGLAFDSSNPEPWMARDVLKACQANPSRDADILTRIAEYALSKGGPDAQILAA